MKCLRFVWTTVSDCRKQTGPPDARNNLQKSHGRFPFDQKFRFEISKISRGKWNSKSGNFPDGYTSPGGPSRSIQFRTEISRKYDREVLQTEIFSNGTVISDQNGPTEKSGPPRKVDLLFRKISGRSEPFHSVSDRNFRKFWLNGKRPISSCVT